MNNYGNIKWYVDVAFSVHKDMRSHTGGFITMRTSGYCVQYRNQKLNTNSSTYAKLVGVEDVLTQVLWTRYFLKYQGCEVRDNIIYQDNQIAIKLEDNGIQSSIKRTCQINIRYYFKSTSTVYTTFL